jgi:hypothetical protein
VRRLWVRRMEENQDARVIGHSSKHEVRPVVA